MRRYSQRHNLGTLSELNVTPLLDLAFVLLIIFMITTPLMEKSAPVILPTDTASANAIDPSHEHFVSLTRTGEIQLNTETVGLDQLEAQLAMLKQTQTDIAVVIRPHKDLPVQKLVDVMAAIQRAGITKVGVATTPETD
jgi:biopolymer transport protein ExbD